MKDLDLIAIQQQVEYRFNRHTLSEKGLLEIGDIIFHNIRLF